MPGLRGLEFGGRSPGAADSGQTFRIRRGHRRRGEAVSLTAVSPQEYRRLGSGIAEFDRVLGGGLVQGSVVLIGGDPGIGKPTLLLQACASLGTEHSVLYVSGEESP